MTDLPEATERVSPDVAAGGGMPLVASATEGGRIGEAIQFAGEVASKEHYEQQQRYSTAQAMEAHNQLHDWMQDTVMDPEKGVLAQNSGKAAPGVADNTMQSFDQASGKIRDGIKDPQAQESFDRMALESKFQLQAHMNGYVSKQLDQYQGETTKATVANSIQSAVNSYSLPDDPATGSHLDYQLQLQKAAIENYWGKKGDAATVQPIIDNEVATARSHTFAAVAEDAVNTGKMDYARQLLADHGQEIESTQRRALEGALKNQGVEQTASDLFSEFVQPQENGTKTTKADYFDTLEHARQNDPRFDGADGLRLYNRVAEQGERYFSIQDQQTAAANKESMDTAIKGMIGGAKLKDALPATQFALLPGAEQEALLKREEQIDRLTMPQDGSAAYWDTMGKIARDPKGAATMNFDPLRGDMSEHDFGKIKQEQIDLIRKQTTTDEGGSKETPNAVRVKVTDEILASMGVSPKIDASDPKNTQRVVTFSNLLDKEIEAQQEKLGRPLTHSETFALGKTLATEQAYQDAAGNTSTKALFDVPGAGDYAFSMKQIPADHLKAITQRMSASGIDIADPAARDQYIINKYNSFMTRQAQGVKTGVPEIKNAPVRAAGPDSQRWIDAAHLIDN